MSVKQRKDCISSYINAVKVLYHWNRCYSVAWIKEIMKYSLTGSHLYGNII
jgi:hypothetical protein